MTTTFRITDPDKVNEAYAGLVQATCIVEALYEIARIEDDESNRLFKVGEALGGVKDLLDQCGNKLAETLLVQP